LRAFHGGLGSGFAHAGGLRAFHCVIGALLYYPCVRGFCHFDR
jgi:hypothetical protein